MPAAVEQTLTLEQADVTVRAHDLYFRVLSGQLGEIATLAADGRLRPRAGAELDAESIERLRALMEEARRILGFAQGESHGVGRTIHPDGNAAFEIELATRKCVADHRVPDPADRGWSNLHDGITARWTAGPEPRARIVDEA